MRENIDLTRGLVFSGQLLLELSAAGVAREEAYSWVQRNAMKAWDEGSNFKELVAKDADIARTLSADQISRAFDLNVQLRNVGRIFERVFGKDAGKSIRHT
jgi:adenylosuccinate lyase